MTLVLAAQLLEQIVINKSINIEIMVDPVDDIFEAADANANRTSNGWRKSHQNNTCKQGHSWKDIFQEDIQLYPATRELTKAHAIG